MKLLEQDTRKRIIRVSVRILVSLILLILAWNYKEILEALTIDLGASTAAVNILFSFVRAILVCITYFSIWLLLKELLDIPSNGKQSDHAVQFEIRKIIHVMSVEPIIDFEIIGNEGTVHIGSSSDGKMAEDYFYNKKYYIDSAQFASVDAIEDYLYKNSSDGVCVGLVAVDGVRNPLEMLHYDFESAGLTQECSENFYTIRKGVFMIGNLNRIDKRKQSIVDRCIRIAQTNNTIRRLIIFGSSVTDRCDDESDLDICLDITGNTHNLSLFNTVADMSMACSGNCDILVYHKIGEPLRGTIDREGVVVYELS